MEDVISIVERIADDNELAVSSDEAVHKIYSCLKAGIPASDVNSLADIINAGWKAYVDPNLWEQNHSPMQKFSALNELILKTVEVLEFEIRMRSP